MSSSSSSASSSQLTATSKEENRSISPGLSPSTLSEWQLFAVLNRANLLQYYNIFISKGGDDINQIMQCDEMEFLEIMSLVGMSNKPLHVRRLQKALKEYSDDVTKFHIQAIQLIGPPPPTNLTYSASSDTMSLLLPGIMSSLTSTSTGDMSVDTSTASPSQPSNSSANELVDPQPSKQPALLSEGVSRATANIVSGQNLSFPKTPTLASRSFSGNSGSQEKEGSASPFLAPFNNDFVSLGDHDPNNPTTEPPVLSDAQLARLTECARNAAKVLPNLPPRYVQNKKRVSKEVLELLTSTPESLPNRLALFRKFSAIYGRFDAKRKPHKVLTLHETTVNEAAAQLCLLVPALLTRRDELFPLARQIVKDAGYHYAKSRKRPCDPADLHSPISSPSTSPPPPGLAEQGFELDNVASSSGSSRNEECTSSSGEGTSRQTDSPQDSTESSATLATSVFLEQWASGCFSQAPSQPKKNH